MLDPVPWDAGCLLLPPATIAKAYQLVPSSCLASGLGSFGRLGRNSEAGVEIAVEVISPREQAALKSLSLSGPLQSLDLKAAIHGSESDIDSPSSKLLTKHRAPTRKMSWTLFRGEKPINLEMSQPMMLPKAPGWIPEDDEAGLPYPDLEAAAKKKAQLMGKLKLAGLKAGKASLSLAAVASAAKAGADEPKKRVKRKESMTQRLHSSFFRAENVRRVFSEG